MSDIPGSTSYVQNEDTEFRASIGTHLLRGIGSTINYLIQNASLAAVGDTKMAFLSEEDFQFQMGSNWVLMDGRDVTGSVYAILTGSTNIPDARGIFLKNKLNARAGINVTEQVLGGYQADGIDQHTHVGGSIDFHGTAFAVFASGTPQQNAGGTNRRAGDGSTPVGAQFTATVAMSPDPADSRPTHITCNFFIKIN